MNTKKLLIITLLFALLLISCGAFGSGNNTNANEPSELNAVNDDNGGADNANDDDNDNDSSGGETDGGLIAPVFPIPDDISNLMADSTSANFQVEATIDEMVAFYRAELVDGWGLEEREILTVISDTGVNLVFDGHESGQAVVVQMVDLGNGTVNVNIRFEDA